MKTKTLEPYKRLIYLIFHANSQRRLRKNTLLRYKDILDKLENTPAMTDDNGDLDRYNKYLHNLIDQNSPIIFYNPDHAHASIVGSVILQNSNEIRMYDRNMDGDVACYGDFLDNLKEFVNVGKCFKFIVDDVSKKSEFYDYLRKSIVVEKKNNVQVRKASNEFKDYISKINKKGRTVDFIIGDNSKIRIERRNKDRMAVGCFNDPHIIDLVEIFDEHFNKCTNLF